MIHFQQHLNSLKMRNCFATDSRQCWNLQFSVELKGVHWHQSVLPFYTNLNRNKHGDIVNTTKLFSLSVEALVTINENRVRGIAKHSEDSNKCNGTKHKLSFSEQRMQPFLLKYGLRGSQRSWLWPLLAFNCAALFLIDKIHCCLRDKGMLS